MDNWQWLKHYERPRFCRLQSNLCVAAFSLMKLVPARHIIEGALADGVLQRGGHIVETSSGTFGLALSLIASSAGFRSTLVTADSLIDEAFRQKLAFLGTRVVITQDAARNGDQKGRLAKLQEILSDDPQAFWPQQYDNPQNRHAYAPVARLALQAAGKIDYLVGSVGTGGSLFGMAAELQQSCNLKIVAVDTHRSVLFGQPLGRRQLRGLGNSIIPTNVIHDMVDEVHWVGALPAYASTHSLLRRHGLFMGPTSGAAMLVAQWLADREPTANILVILPDEGHRYADTIFNPAWLIKVQGWPLLCPIYPTPVAEPVAYDETSWTCLAWNRRALPA